MVYVSGIKRRDVFQRIRNKTPKIKGGRGGGAEGNRRPLSSWDPRTKGGS